jgi:hypothetical protein
MIVLAMLVIPNLLLFLCVLDIFFISLNVTVCEVVKIDQRGGRGSSDNAEKEWKMRGPCGFNPNENGQVCKCMRLNSSANSAHQH